jgi:hypothetical protein
VPGLTPRFPVTTVGPVFVTVEAPSTAKLCAVPKDGATAARVEWKGTAVGRAISRAIEAILVIAPRID